MRLSGAPRERQRRGLVGGQMHGLFREKIHQFEVELLRVNWSALASLQVIRHRSLSGFRDSFDILQACRTLSRDARTWGSK